MKKNLIFMLVVVCVCFLTACGDSFENYQTDSFKVYHQTFFGNSMSYKASKGIQSANELEVKFDLKVDFENNKVKFVSDKKDYEGSMSCMQFVDAFNGKDPVMRCKVRFSEEFDMFYTYSTGSRADVYTSYDPVELFFEAESEMLIKDLNEFTLLLGDYNTIRTEIVLKKAD